MVVVSFLLAEENQYQYKLLEVISFSQEPNLIEKSRGGGFLPGTLR